MARRLFFVDAVRRGAAELAGEDARHLTRVLRAEPGQRYEISDNQSLYLAEIETARKDLVVFRVIGKLEAPAPPVRLTLLIALIKFERLELLIEKATELGAATIIPVISDRSEKGLEIAADKRVERWRRIALESSQQSRRAHLPEIEIPRPYPEALWLETECRLFLDEEPGAPPILKALPEAARRSPADTVALLIGPEGGWTSGERELAAATGWASVSLGRQVLRTETAALAAMAVINAAWQTME